MTQELICNPGHQVVSLVVRSFLAASNYEVYCLLESDTI
jgi:hypothetical protein